MLLKRQDRPLCVCVCGPTTLFVDLGKRRILWGRGGAGVSVMDLEKRPSPTGMDLLQHTDRPYPGLESKVRHDGAVFADPEPGHVERGAVPSVSRIRGKAKCISG